MKKLHLLFFALLFSGINTASMHAFGERFQNAYKNWILKTTAIMGTFFVIEKYPEIYEKLRWKYIQSKSDGALLEDADQTYLKIKSDIETVLKLSQEDNIEIDNKLSTLISQPNALLQVVIKQIPHTDTSWPLTGFIAILKNHRQELLWHIRIIEEKFRTDYRVLIDLHMKSLIKNIDDLKRYIKNSEAYRTEKIERDQYEEQCKQYRRKENIYSWMKTCLFADWVYDFFKMYAGDQMDVKEFMDYLKRHH